MLMGIDPALYYELQDMYLRGAITPDIIVRPEGTPEPQWNDLDELDDLEPF